MKMSSKLLAAAATLSLVSVSACTTDPDTGERRISKTAIGGAVMAVTCCGSRPSAAQSIFSRTVTSASAHEASATSVRFPGIT